MPDLIQFNARICLTAVALCVHQDKVLLVKHKKLGIWLAPGGHIEEGELPHKCAERECWEETGLRVEAFSSTPDIKGTDTEYLPNPISTNLHWISEENYQARLASRTPDKPVVSAQWKRGCEQHVTFLYLVRPMGGLTIAQNVEETDGIGWFTLQEVQALTDTLQDIKDDVARLFLVYPQ